MAMTIELRQATNIRRALIDLKCAFRTDMGPVEIVRAMFTEYALEMVLSEQQLRRSTSFIISIVVEDSSKGYRYLASCLGIFGKFNRERGNDMGLFGPKKDSKSIGERSEAIIMARLLSVGYMVLTPFGENARYDLVIEDADGKFWRVQCKTGWLSEDNATINFNTASNHYHYKGGRTTNARRNYRGQIEYFAVYSPDMDKVYLVPVDHVGITNAYLRLVETENKQKKGIHWAKDYEL